MKGEEIPADLVLLQTPDKAEGVCMVQTMNLDGETNLKRRHALYATNQLDEKGIGDISGKIYAEAPTKIMHSFVGSLSLDGQEHKPLNLENLVMRGTTLQNTQYAIGIVVYTGYDTRIVMNSAPAPSKMSRVELMTNKLIVGVLFFQGALCMVQGILYGNWAETEGQEAWYVRGPAAQDFGDPMLLAVKKYFSYMILLLGMVPISLYVTLEIVKFLQRFLMMGDLEMYYEVRENPNP